MEEKPEEIQARFEQLSVLEDDFENVETELLRKSEALYGPLYKKRAEMVKGVPYFWSLVFEQTPVEIENFLQPSDSKVLAESLDTFEVERFELNDPKGSPRSISLKFGFKENEYFEDKVLEKKFWFRKTKDWAGLVSEPVKIHWKKGQDLTEGLTDAAFKLGEERKKANIDTASNEARKAETETATYKDLVNKIETCTEGSISFFGLFAFVSSYRFVSAAESEAVTKEDNEEMDKIRRGEPVDDDEEEEEEDFVDYQEAEVFPSGDELATIIAEDMWPNAIKYYKQSFEEEIDDEELSDLDMMDEDSDEDDEQEVDIRALVGKGKKTGQSPPAKKQRKA